VNKGQRNNRRQEDVVAASLAQLDVRHVVVDLIGAPPRERSSTRMVARRAEPALNREHPVPSMLVNVSGRVPR
jgi:hypothetical protein